MGLFDRVFRGSDEMWAKAETELAKAIDELGPEAAMQLPDTAYNMACIYAYTGIKIATLGDLRDAMPTIRGMMTREHRTKDIFTSGVATAI